MQIFGDIESIDMHDGRELGCTLLSQHFEIVRVVLSRNISDHSSLLAFDSNESDNQGLANDVPDYCNGIERKNSSVDMLVDVELDESR